MKHSSLSSLRYSVLAFSLLSLQGCALQFLDWVTPSSGYTVEKNLAYGEHPRQQLDWYVPTTATAQPQTLVFFYGGAWQGGSKRQYRFVAQAFAQQGYRVAVVDYRVYPDVYFPGFVNDAAQAVQWLTERSPSSPLVLIGHSAGAHISGLLALDARYLQAAGVDRRVIVGWVGLSGPYDFLPLKEAIYKTIFGTAEDLRETQPITFVSAQAPPALLIHGVEDVRVKLHNTQNLGAALAAEKVPVTVKLYPRADHGITVGALAVRLQKRQPTMADVLRFLRSLPTSL